jgi:hypothetical protein
LKAARGAGERFIFAVFGRSEDGLTAGLEDFFIGAAIYLTIKTP